MQEQLRHRLAQFFSNLAIRLGGLTVRVDDAAKGWTSFSAQPNDQDYATAAQLYRDALEATRKNPLAKSILDITTDFVIGDGITISSSHGRLQTFIEKFWNHPQNRMDQRLAAMCDELTRAGDLFVVLFRNPQDGMSYVRFVTKEQIVHIETADNDWERELAYHQVQDDPLNPKVWLSPNHPAASEADAVMLHYSVNRPIGASLGEGDLDTIIPWLLRYSRMLEDRVRMHWAIRSFLWFVTVPTNKVEAKQAEYSRPPEAGSIVVKDDAEEWEVKSPTLRASDARYDLQAVRHMIDAVGYPPHWRGEGGDANLATATAMQLRPERHLRARQNTLVFILEDMIYHAFLRAAEIGMQNATRPRAPFHRLFTSNVTDISRSDNETLARAANQLSLAFGQLFEWISPAQSTTLSKLALRMLFKFAGEPQEDGVLNAILRENGHSIEEMDEAALQALFDRPSAANSSNKE
ncbi:MAG: hypothetical protein PVH65_00900 [Chloroflexota bacterium]